jgi:HEAT repeat protein
LILSPSEYQSAPLLDLLHAASRGHAGVDQRFVKAILDRGRDTIPQLVGYGIEERETDRVDIEIDLLNIFRAWGGVDAMPFYLHCARHQDEEIADEMAGVFTSLGALSVEPLLALHEELGEEDGGEAAFWLASLRLRDQRITDVLVERFDFDAGDGAFLLGIHGDPSTLPLLKERLEEVNASGDKSSEWVRRGIEAAINEIENPSPAGVEEPFDIWPLYPETAQPVFDILDEEELLALLESPEPDYRRAVVEEFGLKAPNSRVRARLLEVAKADPEPLVRARAWESLGGLEDADDIRRAMRERLLDESAPDEERAGALVGLALGPDDEAVDRMMLEFYQRPAQRAKALEAMRRSLDRRYEPYFPPHLDDSDIDVRRQAIWGVGNLVLGAEAARLRKYFDDEELRADALYAYALAVPGETSHIRIPRLFRKLEELAGGLSAEESYLVKTALNDRLDRHGLAPAFFTEQGEEPEDWAEGEPLPVSAEPPPAKVGRNDPCPCGSGKKYKKCCGA